MVKDDRLSLDRLDALVTRMKAVNEFQRQALEAIVGRLALYEIPVERVRTFLAGVEQDAMTGFGDIPQDRALHELVVALLERLTRIEDYVVDERVKLETAGQG